MEETIQFSDVFDRALEFPDMEAGRRLRQLVGVDTAKSRLAKLLGVLINPQGPKHWAEKHHGRAEVLLRYVDRRTPLVILAGDVGTGKTELAETIGDQVARTERISVTLYPLSLAARGSGKVGEMTQLLSFAFDQIAQKAERLRRTAGKAAGGGIIFLLDEADALTQSRETGQMHHEDRAGVNAFIRGVDRLAQSHFPVAVILCTNRLSAIDPAVRRRAADVFEFKRPNPEQRRAVLEPALLEVGFTEQQISTIVDSTGARNGDGHGFTFSDLTQRLLPTLVLDAYPDSPIRFDRALELLKEINPTPPFREN